ncbi:MAG TPA: DM13 domain-containing protein, partial [Phototrophicaceae bacterium]|nr:DM13 domain-containing protein [Phototrophicaceae bacterium]
QTLDMVVAALQPDVVMPEDQQRLPEISGQQEVFTGKFIDITVNRGATGDITIYEQPDGDRYIWFENFSAIKGPDLRVYLSTQNSTMLEDLEADEELGLSPDDIHLGRLDANVGNQKFDIPRDADLTLFNSIIIFSQGLNLIYSMADF